MIRLKSIFAGFLILLFMVNGASASPFTTFTKRVHAIREIKRLPLLQISEDGPALQYLTYLQKHEGGDAVSTENWYVTSWSGSVSDCSGTTGHSASAADRADALLGAEELHYNWPKSGLFDADHKHLKIAILKVFSSKDKKPHWLIAVPRWKKCVK